MKLAFVGDYASGSGGSRYKDAHVGWYIGLLGCYNPCKITAQAWAMNDKKVTCFRDIYENHTQARGAIGA